jgi:glycosyltransferase involved in cell wall biosynthesis
MYNILCLNKTSSLSGAEIGLLLILEGLSKDTFKSQVILPEEGLFEKRLKSRHIPVRIIKRSGVKASINPLFYLQLMVSLLSFTRRLTKIIRREDIHLIYANSFYDTFYAGLAKKITGTPLVTSLWDILPAGLKRNAWLRLVELFSDKIIVVSGAVRDMFVSDRKAPEKVDTVYPGVDMHKFSPAIRGDAIRKEFGLQDEFLAVNVGVLLWHKGQELLIKAAATVLKAIPRAKFMIVGAPLFQDEAYQEHLKRLTRNLNLDEKVIFTGFREDIPDILAAADLYVHCAVQPDPFPFAILEAMASGKAVVAPRCGGIPELIKDNVNGLLFESGDIEAISRAMISLLKDSDLRQRLAQAARKHIEEHFSLKKYIGETEKLFACLLKNERAGKPRGETGSG